MLSPAPPTTRADTSTRSTPAPWPRPRPATTSRARFDVPLRHEGLPADQVIDELARAAEGGQLGSGSARFFAWVIGGALPSAIAAEWLVSAWDQERKIFLP